MERTKIHIEQLKSEVLARFGRTLDSPTDYDALSLSITESVGELISVSTLKRLYGYDRRPTTPRPSTLSTLARYAGYAGWSDFVESRDDMPVNESSKTSNLFKQPYRRYVMVAVAIIVAVGIVVCIPPKRLVTPPPTVDPVEQIRDKWAVLTATKCDSIRSLRDSCTLDEYIELVESFYYPFTFETLRDGIREDIELLNIDDTVEQSSIESDIFSHCQEISVSLVRECYRRNDDYFSTHE